VRGKGRPKGSHQHRLSRRDIGVVNKSSTLKSHKKEATGNLGYRDIIRQQDKESRSEREEVTRRTEVAFLASEMPQSVGSEFEVALSLGLWRLHWSSDTGETRKRRVRRRAREPNYGETE